MIYGNLRQLGKSYEYPEYIYTVLTKLQQIDFEKLPLGSLPLDNEGTALNYMEISPGNIETALSEIHGKYIDIQISVDGQEVYGFVPNTNDNVIEDNRLETDDICLFKTMNHEVRIPSKPYDFFIFFPNDVHHACNVLNDKKVRRAVVKVPVALLDC